MEEYIFTPIAVVIPWYIRLHNWLMAMRDRRVLSKQFRTTLHLEKLQKENLSFKLPKSYPIETNEISYLYNVRSRILSSMHDHAYSKKQVAIDDQAKKLKTECDMLKKRRVAEKSELDRVRAKQKNHNSNSDDTIALQSSVAQAEATLDNTDTAIANCKDQIEKLARTKKDNVRNWQKQIDTVEKVTEATIGRYVKNATRKVELAYGFANFVHPIEKYNNEMQKILKGDY